jgi:hypothetical protein
MKKIVLMLLVLIIPVFIFTGCTTMESVAPSNETKSISMFVLIEEGDGYKIVYHRDTKVMYTYSTSMYNLGNFTVMVDSEGNPLLYKG